MITFVTDLWESIFTPGTTPTLVFATHLSLASLTLLLSVFAFLTGINHLYYLLAISIILWGLITWFIGEVQRIQAEEAAKEGEEKPEEKKTASATATTTSTKASSKPKKRKV